MFEDDTLATLQGKWIYWGNSYTSVFVYIVSPTKNYGITLIEGNCFENLPISFDESASWNIVEISSVERALIDYAKNVYKKGNYIPLNNELREHTDDSSLWYFNGHALFTQPFGYGGACLFSGGTWAKLKEDGKIDTTTIIRKYKNGKFY